MTNFFNNITTKVVENKIDIQQEIEPKQISINPFNDIQNTSDNSVTISKNNVKTIEKLSNNVSYNEIDIMNLQNITQTYDNGRVTVFDDFNLEIKDIVNKGQFVTLLGPSGCGKTTILRYIAGIQKPNSGNILLKGQQLTEKDRVPMVFQQYSSFPWFSVLDNVSLPLTLKNVPKKEAYERAMEMIKIVGLAGHENKYAKYPLLSGGQLQRVAIARNLVANSQILLMDEPFGALDIVTRRSMQSFMRKIFQDNNNIDPTVILVTHDIREAVFLSTDIYILDANPASVRCHIEVDLPDVREPHIKRNTNFLEYVNYVEDFMEKIEIENIERKKEKITTEEKVNKKSFFSFLLKK